MNGKLSFPLGSPQLQEVEGLGLEEGEQADLESARFQITSGVRTGVWVLGDEGGKARW